MKSNKGVPAYITLGVPSRASKRTEEESKLLKDFLKKRRAEYSREYDKLNREKRKLKARKHRAENKDKVKETVKKSRAKNKEKIKVAQKIYRTENKAVIKEKYLENREENLKQRREYKSKNKEKIRASAKKYRTENADKIKAYFKIYNPKNRLSLRERRRKHYLRHRERTLLINKIWLQNNKEARNKQTAAYAKKRRKIDPLFKLANNVRSRLRVFLWGKGIKKSQRTFDLVGCTVLELKNHLEKQFLPGMHWDNHTNFGWHIDHIIPLSAAESSEDLEFLCHYTNLQPLWWRENIIKKDKF